MKNMKTYVDKVTMNYIYLQWYKLFNSFYLGIFNFKATKYPP